MLNISKHTVHNCLFSSDVYSTQSHLLIPSCPPALSALSTHWESAHSLLSFHQSFHSFFQMCVFSGQTLQIPAGCCKALLHGPRCCWTCLPLSVKCLTPLLHQMRPSSRRAALFVLSVLHSFLWTFASL